MKRPRRGRRRPPRSSSPPSAALRRRDVPGRRRHAADGSDNRWTPNAATVKVGETVTWSFAGTAIPHNVKSTRQLGRSPNAPGRRRARRSTYAFTTPGTYEFFCQLHAHDDARHGHGDRRGRRRRRRRRRPRR